MDKLMQLIDRLSAWFTAMLAYFMGRTSEKLKNAEQRLDNMVQSQHARRRVHRDAKYRKRVRKSARGRRMP